MKRILFETHALEQFEEWEQNDKKIFSRIVALLDAIRHEPFKGIGKPEPLRYQFKGCWSRRINFEHRLIYRVTDNAIVVIACKYHY